MKITPRGGATITLVDPAVGYYQPIPAQDAKVVLTEYPIEGGETQVFIRGTTRPAWSPQHVEIHQASDAAAQVVLLALRAAVLDVTKQPMAIQWHDGIAGPFDGNYMVDVNSGEIESDFRGRIYLTLQVREDPS